MAYYVLFYLKTLIKICLQNLMEPASNYPLLYSFFSDRRPILLFSLYIFRHVLSFDEMVYHGGDFLGESHIH